MNEIKQTSLKEAAEEWAENEAYGKSDAEFEMAYKGFIAGAEWQKEQDQPITGNSLEQEWLRYVDKKKKECRGELPSLGEYGWLQIARHFAEWKKEQMMKDVVEGEVENSCFGIVYLRKNLMNEGYSTGDKVKILILKDGE